MCDGARMLMVVVGGEEGASRSFFTAQGCGLRRYRFCCCGPREAGARRHVGGDFGRSGAIEPPSAFSCSNGLTDMVRKKAVYAAYSAYHR